MAYPNYFNGGFYPQYQSGAAPDVLGQYKAPYQQPMMQPVVQQSSDTMLWVLNENEATSYPVAPNNSVVLWDKNNPTVYVKSVNAQGVPSMRVLDFVERKTDGNSADKHECNCGGKLFATKEQFDELWKKIEALEEKCEQSSEIRKARESK